MKIHYFYRREYNTGFYNLEIEAWLEEKETSRLGCERLCFTRLERLRIFLSKDNKSYHNHHMEHEFAEKSCYGHYTYTRKELAKDMKKKEFLSINGRNYARFRKVAIALYQKQPLPDFSKFKGKQTYSIHQIIGD